MNHIHFYIQFYFQELWKKRWFLLLVLWIISILGIFFIFLIPNQYRTYAGISIDTDRLLSQVIGENTFSLEKTTRSQARKVSQIIYSTDNLQKVLQEIDPESYQYSRRKEILIVEQIREKLRFKDIGKDYYEMSYTHSDPNMAYKTLKAILSIFIEKNIKRLSSNSEKAELISNDSVKTKQEEFSILQKQYTDFQNKHMEIIDPNGILMISLRKAEDFTGSFHGNKQKIVRRIQNLSALLEQTPHYIHKKQGDMSACHYEGLYQKKNNLIAKGYTRSHPDIIYLEQAIQEAKRNCAQNTRDKRHSNPTFLQLSSEIELAKEELQTYEEQNQKYKEDILSIKAKLVKQPIILEKLNELERQKNKAQKRLGVADLKNDRLQETLNVNRKTGLVRYDVVQKVYYPVKPMSPNRFLLLVGCLIASIAGTTGLVIVKIQMENKIPSLYHLKEIFDLPILGGITKIKTEEAIGVNVAEISLWGSGIISLFCLYGFLIYYAEFLGNYTNLQAIFKVF